MVNSCWFWRWAWVLYCSVNFIFLFLKVKIIMFLKWKSYIIRTDDWNFAEWEASKQKVFGICRFWQTLWISRRYMWPSQAGFSCWVYATFKCIIKLLIASGSLHMSKFMPSTAYPTPEDTHPTSSHSSSSSIQSLSCVWLFETPWTAACQASLSITNSQSLPKFMPIESVMPSNHLILCRPLLLLPSIFPSIRVFSNESVLRIRWPKYWSFSFNISPSNEHPGLISFRMDWLDLLVVQGTLKSLLQQSSSRSQLKPLPGKVSPTPPPPTTSATAIHLCLFVRVLSPSLESIFHGGNFPVSQIKLLEVTLVTFLSITSHIQLSEILLTPPQKISKICPLLTTFITTNVLQATTSVYLPSSTPDSYRPSSTKKPGESFGSKSEMPFLYFWHPQNEMQSPYLGPADSQFSSVPCLSSPFFLTSLQHPPATSLALSLGTLPLYCLEPFPLQGLTVLALTSFHLLPKSHVFRHHPYSPFILLRLQSSYPYMLYFINGC